MEKSKRGVYSNEVADSAKKYCLLFIRSVKYEVLRDFYWTDKIEEMYITYFIYN